MLAVIFLYPLRLSVIGVGFCDKIPSGAPQYMAEAILFLCQRPRGKPRAVRGMLAGSSDRPS